MQMKPELARRHSWALSRCTGAVARVVELADTPDLGSGVERRAGSSPVLGTNFYTGFYTRSQNMRQIEESWVTQATAAISSFQSERWFRGTKREVCEFEQNGRFPS